MPIQLLSVLTLVNYRDKTQWLATVARQLVTGVQRFWHVHGKGWVAIKLSSENEK